MTKAEVTLGGVPLAADGPVTWVFRTGSVPYFTTVSVHNTHWRRNLKQRVGKPLTLNVVDHQGVRITIKDLYILHEVASSKPSTTAFIIADKRWKWQYKLIARDYNIPRKTGDRTALNKVPVETQLTVDEYQYRKASLDGRTRWTPKRAVEDILDLLEGRRDVVNKKTGETESVANYRIDSFPIEAKGTEGEYSLQNIRLRDQGDVALSRVLAMIPGAEVYIDKDGIARVFDGTDLRAADAKVKRLPPSTWDGDALREIDRAAIRPRFVDVHYQREIECLFEHSDDYAATTVVPPRKRDPFLENVIPTTDPSTSIPIYDPESGETKTTDVPPGTWVEMRVWLAAMDAIRPADSERWTFETIQRHWLAGDLDGVLGGRGLDLDPNGNVAMRIQALKQHFRQTYRINRSYMERIDDLRAVRVALLDPVTGARAPAAVWSQGCSVPTTKGKRMSARKAADKAFVYRNVDYLLPSRPTTHTESYGSGGGAKIIETSPGPQRVSILDRDLGIFRMEWILSPYGTVESWIPCHLVGESDSTVPKSITRNLSDQDRLAVGAGMTVESASTGIFLRPTLDFKVMLTIVPAAPNNKKRFHRETIVADDIQPLFRTEYGITGGDGPTLEVFIPPGEATARFAWDEDEPAKLTLSYLLGLRSDDPNDAGWENPILFGFQHINRDQEIRAHARAVAAEHMSAFADSLMGRHTSAVPRQGLSLIGNMASATLQISSAPSAKVNAVHEFPGQQKKISRLAVLPEEARQIILGIVPFGQGDK